MGFFTFLVLLAIAYLLWRITDQLPDLIFRMSEIQRDVAEIRRSQSDDSSSAESSAPASTSASDENSSSESSQD